ncbi:Mobile element protein [Candidatus Enterovibrio escicola]|uniref:Mobile element protein n=1 Tax=Candidatus Enterovibrio escicola TaxID=1927127 RepID=A0A2A5T186_9GAMM|nr:Mobile element protein [Candidatus Enterovibrio escacola]
MKKSLLTHSGVVEERYLIYFSIGYPYLMFHFGVWTVSIHTISLPENKHIVGKLYTQRIERKDLTLRTRLKRLNRK